VGLSRSLPSAPLIWTDEEIGFFFAAAVAGVSAQPRIRLFNPDTLHKPTGYSHVGEVLGGKVVFIAGQVALDHSGNLVGKDDFKAQTRQVFESLKAAIAAAGGDFNDVVKLNYYAVDLLHLPDIREVRDKFINTRNPPASTAVEVRRLARPEFLIEVEAVVVVK
jgi:enamine deaminase RidA (YjgF/YER057c/UK114 family)